MAFCDNEKSADVLAELVKQGIKRATTGLYYSYEITGETLPKVGDLSIIVDWQGSAQCIIKTTKVTLLSFNEVTEEFEMVYK
ncbi:ASCH domain-containing protein [Desulfosporosinus sp. FKB]|uniref:ASCH domain-containing protein n=1 Tax=Desulfosporosinus sp. FKB TaxID=1969835 RepID=UPI001FA8CE60|nr:ASCH domain-containing protein [Desulfosporosinus sp. FKB]